MATIKEKLINKIWSVDINTLSWWRASLLSIVRFVYILVIDFLDGQLNLRAMSLVFTTMLSIVPLIAVSFSVMKAFGMHNQMEPMLLQYLAPLGTQGEEIAQQIMGFVNNIKVGALGILGLLVLFYVIARLIKKIEFSFNYTWRIQQTGSLIRRLGNYVVIMFGFVLVFGALALTGTAMNTGIAQKILAIEPFGTLLSFSTKLIPYLMIIAAFTVAYLFTPNTKVRFIPALTGGIVAGILWQTVGWVFATFVSASMATSYTAIYSSFAFLFVFMIWLWWSWLILLIGSSVAFYKQHPEYLYINSHDLRLTNRQKEELALQVMTVIGKRFYNHQTPIDIESIVNDLKLPQQSIEQQLDLFEHHGLLVRAESDTLAYAPARPFEELDLKAVLDTVREPGPNSHLKSSLNVNNPFIVDLLKELDAGIDQVLSGKTIRDIVKSVDSQDYAPASSTITDIKKIRNN
ncbi:MAG: YihY/virulence factor BrkB family protein [Pseudomonadota bacterium]